MTWYRRLGTAALVAATVSALTSCDRTPPAHAEASHVDNLVPRAEALARFRHGVPRVNALAGGASSRADLVRAFVDALERADTAALQRLTMTRAEFAWLYYETTPQGLPPYDLSPGLLWFLLEGRGAQGLAKLMADRAGRPLRLAGHRCDGLPAVEGRNRIHGPCVVQLVPLTSDTVSERLFGLILERDGRFKFVNLSNRL